MELTLRRHADVYVFALLAHQDKASVDPLDLAQWKFYVLPTSTLDSRNRSQYSITLKSLSTLCLKEATMGILNEGDFFGEGCLTGQPVRLRATTAMTDCSAMRIGKKSMMEVLHRKHAFSDMFVAYLLTRNIRYEEDLVDQLFNSSERRLARVLLLLAQFGRKARSCNSQN